LTQARLSTRVEGELDADTLQALEPVRVKGALAEVYLQFANSEPALRAYLGMESAIRQGSLSLREVECIKLLISELTGCEHCLSIHSMKAKAASVDKQMQLKVRAGESVGEARLDALLTIARQLFHQRGSIPDELLRAARAAEISDQTLVDLTLAMSTIFFTNITNHINDSRSSLPPAPPLTDLS